MKTIYEFYISKPTETEEISSSENENKETVTITKKVIKDVAFKFAIKKPSRAIAEEAELFYSVKVAEGVKSGMLTRAMLVKRYANDDGIFSEKEIKQYKDSFAKLELNQKEIKPLTEKAEKTDEDNKKIEEINKENAKLLDELQKYENAQARLYDQTAESRARNKVVMWWILYLAYKLDEKGNFLPVFNGETYDSKLKHYDELEEDGTEFDKEIMRRFALFVSFWASGKAEKKEEFDNLWDLFSKIQPE